MHKASPTHSQYKRQNYQKYGNGREMGSVIGVNPEVGFGFRKEKEREFVERDGDKSHLVSSPSVKKDKL